jgi:hypothetical protein
MTPAEELLFQQERCFVAGWFRARSDRSTGVMEAWREYKKEVLTFPVPADNGTSLNEVSKWKSFN